MRGVALVQAPTSLLAMVDSSWAAKSASICRRAKIWSGAFKDPLAVFADTCTLSHAAAPSSCAAGWRRSLKAGLIADPPLLDHLLAHGSAADRRDHRAGGRGQKGARRAGPARRRACALISTWGIPSATRSNRSAVTPGSTAKRSRLGLVAAARLSARRGLCARTLAATVERAVGRWACPRASAATIPARCGTPCSHDKKWRDGAARFVLLEGMGAAGNRLRRAARRSDRGAGGAAGGR